MRTPMRKKLFLLLILLIMFGAFIAVRYYILNTQNVNGRIRVTSSPTATVFINNLVVGRTPFEDKYKSGEYILKLIPEKTATETASWQGKIQIYKNALTYVNRELGTSDLGSAGEIFTITKMEKPPANSSLGEIYVETEPQGAIVYLDNDEKGVAPLILADVIKGDHELSVFMPGFLRRTQKVNVDSGYRVNASFKLAFDPNQQRLSSITPVPTKEASSSAATTPTKEQVKILDTPTGWLRVRSDPSVDASESARVNPGETFDILEEQEGWYRIQYNSTTSGWVYSQYAQKITE